MKFKANHDYRSSMAGPFVKGGEYDLTETLALIINIDSPGALTAVVKPKAKKVTKKVPVKSRKMSSPPKDR